MLILDFGQLVACHGLGLARYAPYGAALLAIIMAGNSHMLYSIATSSNAKLVKILWPQLDLLQRFHLQRMLTETYIHHMHVWIAPDLELNSPRMENRFI